MTMMIIIMIIMIMIAYIVLYTVYLLLYFFFCRLLCVSLYSVIFSIGLFHILYYLRLSIDSIITISIYYYYYYDLGDTKCVCVCSNTVLLETLFSERINEIDRYRETDRQTDRHIHANDVYSIEI